MSRENFFIYRISNSAENGKLIKLLYFKHCTVNCIVNENKLFPCYRFRVLEMNFASMNLPVWKIKFSNQTPDLDHTVEA